MYNRDNILDTSAKDTIKFISNNISELVSDKSEYVVLDRYKTNSKSLDYFAEEGWNTASSLNEITDEKKVIAFICPEPVDYSFALLDELSYVNRYEMMVFLHYEGLLTDIIREKLLEYIRQAMESHKGTEIVSETLEFQVNAEKILVTILR